MLGWWGRQGGLGAGEVFQKLFYFQTIEALVHSAYVDATVNRVGLLDGLVLWYQ